MLMFVSIFQFLISIPESFDLLAGCLYSFLIVVWKVVLIYSFWFIFFKWLFLLVFHYFDLYHYLCVVFRWYFSSSTCVRRLKVVMLNFCLAWLHKEAVVIRCSVKKVFLEISQNSQENTCARASFLIKLQASGLQLYQKRDSAHSCFPVNFTKFLRHLFLQNISGRLLLKVNLKEK